MNLQRYSRQTVFAGIGVEGQKKLLCSRVALIGVGATGTVIANNLCRAGTGALRLIDRDYVEFSNLQRQTLYTEEDVRRKTPKAVAACEHLKEVNAEIEIEPVCADVNSSNIESLIADADLVLDGSDNLEVRYLINEACVKQDKPWIYAGALACTGMTVNILPRKTPCLHCLFPNLSMTGTGQTCSTAGVVNGVTGMIASIASVEAMKILIGSPNVRKSLLYFDLWNNDINEIEVERNPDCPICERHEYKLLNRLSGSYTTSLCGRDSVQIVPEAAVKIDFDELAQKLRKVGSVQFSKFMLQYSDDKVDFNLFPDGRAIINKVNEPNAARSVYSEYIGL